MGNPEGLVVVTGDVMMDCNLANHPREAGPNANWTPEDRARMGWHPGGAALLFNVIQNFGACKKEGPVQVALDVPQQLDKKFWPHSYALWDFDEPDKDYDPLKYIWDDKSKSPHHRAKYDKNMYISDDANRIVWRVRRSLGSDREPKLEAPFNEVPCPEYHKKKDWKWKIIVVNDASYGFSNQREYWPEVLKEGFGNSTSSWLMVKISRALEKSEPLLWEELLTPDIRKRTIAILNVNDLRATKGVQVPPHLSWERTVECLAQEFTTNQCVKFLKSVRYSIVSFGTAGAVLISSRRREGFDLRLMSPVNDVGDIPSEGRKQDIVADVQGVLHFRIFDADGQMVVNTDEKRLPDKASQLAELKQLLSGLWGQPQISSIDRDRVIDAVTSIVGHTSREDETVIEQLRLVFSPRYMEREWENPRWGRMIGYTMTLTAALVHQLIQHGIENKVVDDECLCKGIKAGIFAMRQLYLSGFRCQSAGYDYQFEKKLLEAYPPTLEFPDREVAKYLDKGGLENTDFAKEQVLAHVDDPDPNRRGTPAPGWTILNERRLEWRRRRATESIESMANHIVNGGLTHREIPMCSFNELTTVDRREIEALRSIQELINEYSCNGQGGDVKPLSLAVFGPPGSGKSTAVTQVALSVEKMAKAEIQRKEFNLSQFEGPEALHGALHQVRDIGLSGKLPLVFWDEFDTMLDRQPLGWLRYFLAPMNDGTFTQGPFTHSIGRCIFAFAGGTYERMAQFNTLLADDANEKDKVLARDAKVRDFISRLLGYIDVFGINPETNDPNGADFHLIRRAILFRELLWNRARHLFVQESAPYISGRTTRGRLDNKIDDGVLRAFLYTRKYKHNARSMFALVSMSSLEGKHVFDQSSLPPSPLLDLHVDANDFEEKLS